MILPLTLGTICKISYPPILTVDPPKPCTSPTTVLGLYMQMLPDGRAEFLLNDGQIVLCTPHRVTVSCLPTNPAYQERVAELFPQVGQYLAASRDFVSCAEATTDAA